jgi:hypothetical protein
MTRHEEEIEEYPECVRPTEEDFAGSVNECDALDERESLVEVFGQRNDFGARLLCNEVRQQTWQRRPPTHCRPAV